MTRFWFGAKLPDWTFNSRDGVDGVDDLVQAAGGVQVTFWNQETNGTQYIDLLDADDVVITAVVSSDGSDGRSPGTIPPFQGPDGVASMWASANDGPRLLIEGHTGQALLDVIVQAGQTRSDLTAHVGAPNPHSMASNDLTDYSDATPDDGQVPVFDTDAGKYVPTTVQGLNPADFVSTRGGSEIVIPAGDTTTKGLVIRVPPGDRTGGANTFEVWWNAGSEAVPNWALVTRLDEYGQVRLQGSSAGRVPARVRQFNASQTARLFEWADWSDNALAWVDAVGRMRAPNLAITPTWNQDTGTAGTGIYRYYNPTGTALVLRGFIVSAGGTAPAGGDYIVNPKVDGVAVYASASRPKITAGNRTSGLVTNLSTTIWPAGSYLTVDVDSVPTTAPTKITIQAVAY